MIDERSRHRQFEDEFIGQLQARAIALTAGKFPADEVVIEPTAEGVDAVRDELRRLEIYDRDAIDGMAGTRTVQMRFLKKALAGLFRTTVSRVRVRVIAPVEGLLKGRSIGPASREAVLDALARYQVLPHNARPTGVVLASATGFSAEAKALVESVGPPTLVLVGGREDRGWEITLPKRVQQSPWAALFELETQDERVKRLLHHLDREAHLVDSRGVSIAALADKMGLPLAETESLVRQACRREPRLMTVTHEGVTHVCRTPIAAEGGSMSLWTRIRKLLGLKPTAAERVREWTVQRIQLEQQRAEVDRRIDALEAEEREALAGGAAATTDAVRKQVAGKLMRVRKELKRQRAQAQVFTNQIDVIGTQIHHLALTEHGRRIALPDAKELAQQAAEAEQMMSELSANAELANSIEVTGQTAMMAEEEAAIFEEFKQAAAERAPGASPSTATPAREGASPEAARPDRVPPIPGGDKEKAARPEMG